MAALFFDLSRDRIATQTFASLIPPTASRRAPPVHMATGGHGFAMATCLRYTIIYEQIDWPSKESLLQLWWRWNETPPEAWPPSATGRGTGPAGYKLSPKAMTKETVGGYGANVVSEALRRCLITSPQAHQLS